MPFSLFLNKPKEAFISPRTDGANQGGSSSGTPYMDTNLHMRVGLLGTCSVSVWGGINDLLCHRQGELLQLFLPFSLRSLIPLAYCAQSFLNSMFQHSSKKELFLYTRTYKTTML
jgi:hypothetical protein